jgi:nucleotide-binding universal stress UspA family protein
LVSKPLESRPHSCHRLADPGEIAREQSMKGRGGFILVGVDDSPGARAALEFAVEEGVAHGYAVELVTTWLWSSPYDGMDHVSSIAEGHDVARAAQDVVLEGVLGERAERPVISQTVVHGHAGRALVERAEGARMLVVGSSRKGAVARAVLGSVSEYCVRHACAPVVVVADPRRLEHRAPVDLHVVRLEPIPVTDRKGT